MWQHGKLNEHSSASEIRNVYKLYFSCKSTKCQDEGNFSEISILGQRNQPNARQYTMHYISCRQSKKGHVSYPCSELAEISSPEQEKEHENVTYITSCAK